MSASDSPLAPGVNAAESDIIVDLVGDPVAAGIRVGFNGNQFMVVPALLDLWHERIPTSPSVFYETLPPGILVDQVTVGAIRVGTLTIPAPLDVIAAGPDMLAGLAAGGLIDLPRDYATNDLALLVDAGNLADIADLTDLARPGVRIAMPNPATEGVGRLIVDALQLAGGDDLVDRVMVAKYADGETRLTSIHHRQSVEWVRRGLVDVAPLWTTEASHHTARCPWLRQIHIDETVNRTGRYSIAAVDTGNAWRMWWARSFVTFMGTAEVADLYAAAGFGPAHVATAMREP